MPSSERPESSRSFSAQRSDSSLSQFVNRDAATKSNAIQVPQISLPKGGGALKGVDEKFQVNPSNGTASFSIPLPLSSNRNGFSPSLSLSYNSAAGNSVLGIGWSLDFPSIQRKTDKKLPRYRDFAEEDQDTFMFSGVEDLVFMLEYKNNEWIKVQSNPEDTGGYLVQRYRPRIEGSFSRIERILHKDHGMYWRVTTRENVTTIFGRSKDCRITDPEDDSRVFQWLPELSFDDKGSVVVFEYQPEDGAGLINPNGTPVSVFDKNRFNDDDNPRFVNSYLKRVLYGNSTAYYPYDQQNASPFNPPAPGNNVSWHFELVLDYGEHDVETPTTEAAQGLIWATRPDAFSSYRSGFEIRTCRLLKRVLMFHRFNELNGGMPTLVRSLDFKHIISDSDRTDRETELEFLESITQSGYVWLPGINRYSKKSLPPMEFTYQPLVWNQDIKDVRQEELVHSPVGLSSNYQWVDLYNEGINGILTEQAGGWFYKHNLGDLEIDAAGQFFSDGKVHFEQAKLVMNKPSLAGLSSGVLQLQDLEANGEKQLVVSGNGLEGYFELNDEEKWQPFRSFLQNANIDLKDPNVRTFDINGDGQPEIVMTEENAFCWFPSKGKLGHDTPELAPKPFDEEQGPAIVFSDQTQSIFLADMSGDGLTDIVRIRNGEVCYWANLGHGRFGRKVTMANSPLFDRPEQFNPAYIQLADISGTGATDIVYLGQNRFKAWLNLSGNRWGEAEGIEPFFPTEQPNRVTVTDLLGNGTGCIVWSSELPGYGNSPMRYMDLMGGKKPYIMTKYVNNFGKETRLEYKSSTWYYLLDKLEGKPWITKLPFPVQVVSKSIVEEKVSKTRFTTEYRYHHGCYDHPEREFRGFGMVEQTDTEQYETWQKNNTGTSLEKSEELFQPPVLTKTWYHTGAFLGRERILTQFENEYWHEEYKRRFSDLGMVEPKLPDARVVAGHGLGPLVLNDMSADEWREALRACKGVTLRQEVFALDAPGADPESDEFKKQFKPYTVATHSCHIQLLQPRQGYEFAVFMPSESEAISIHYERNETDPRIAHTLNVKIDELGNVLEAASVVYKRKQADLSLPIETRIEQARTLITFTRNTYTNDEVNHAPYRLRLIAEAETFEITDLNKQSDLYGLTDFENVLAAPQTTPLQYFELADGNPRRRLIEHIRTLYYKDDLSGNLPLKSLESRGISFESYQLAYTPELLGHLFPGKIADPETTMMDSKFTHNEGDANWWIRSGTVQYTGGAVADEAAAKARFFTPVSYTDPFGSVTSVSWFAPHFMFMQSVEDAVHNRTKVEQLNFRVLSPQRLRDANDNLSAVITDELGLVKALAMEGKDLDGDGVPELETADDLAGLTEASETEAADVQAFFVAEDSEVMRPLARSLLKNATARFVYDFDRYHQSALAAEEAANDCERGRIAPVVAASINREQHHSQNPNSPLQMSFEYTDGMGKVAMKKVQAEPGIAKKLVVHDDCSFTLTDEDTAALNPRRLRWLGNGRTVLNNKGNPVKQYEPYFSVSPHFEDAKELVETGVTPILKYDPLGRLIRTDFPDWTYSKVEFDAWKQMNYDQNDTVLDSRWHTDRIGGAMGALQQQAAQKAAAHDGTPPTMHLDTLGRPILSVEHNRTAGLDEFYHTRIELDIEGNARRVVDARNNPVMQYAYDMLGHRVYQDSMDAGQRWMLNNVAGNPVVRWDRRNHVFSFEYDALQRPTFMRVKGGDVVDENGNPLLLDNVYEKISYGEGQAMDREDNLRGKVFEHYDTAGLLKMTRYDFKGNLLESHRRLAIDYRNAPDWSGASLAGLLEVEDFISRFEYDALNRVFRSQTPDGSLTEPGYNEANLLESVRVTQGGIVQTFVRNIDYNEKGQRQSIALGNGVKTSYEYDPETFRLLHIETRRQDGSLLQDLCYTFDPVGNITHMVDNAIPTTFFNNFRIEPALAYTYDALYRLVEAAGREHIAQAVFGATDNWDDLPFLKKYNPGDPMAMRNYEQSYRYDAVGNIIEMHHHPTNGDPNWTRTYAYEADSNRLHSTTVGADTYLYPHHPRHGFISAMRHLPGGMRWNFKDELQASARQVVNNGTPETTWYVYDAEGQRVRKVTDRQAAPGSDPTRKNERIYLGGAEVYRQYGIAAAPELERWTLHVMDDKQRVAMVETRTQGMDETPERLVRFQFSNHLGTATLETDDRVAARVISYEEYHPYGTTSYQAVNLELRAAGKRYRYTGMERDEETGLGYHGARYYVLWLGRWLSSDPAGLIDGVNLYSYVGNSSLNATDSSGMQEEDIGRDTGLRRAAQEVHEARPDLDAPRPPGTPRRTVSRSQARAEADRGAATARRELTITDPEVQAGHTQAARHVPESGASRIQTNDPATFQQLHSRRGRGLDVTVTEPGGRTRVTTRHRAQEGLIDEAVSRSRSPGGGRLTPEGQAAAGQEVIWRTQGTGFDQREVQTRRQSGTFDEGAAIERSPAVQRYRGRSGRGTPSPPTGGTSRPPGGSGAAGSLLLVLLEPSLNNALDLVRGGLRIDPEARLRHGDVLHITQEDIRAANLSQAERESELITRAIAQRRGISESQAREDMNRGARSGPSYPTIGPDPGTGVSVRTLLREGEQAHGASWWDSLRSWLRQ